MGMAELLIAILGACGITEWIRHDHRIIELQIKLETLDEHPLSFLRRVLGCGFCLSHWVAILTVLLWFVVPFGKFVVTAFAIVRGANLLNDLFKQYNRSPDRPEFHGETDNDYSATGSGETTSRSDPSDWDSRRRS